MREGGQEEAQLRPRILEPGAPRKHQEPPMLENESRFQSFCAAGIPQPALSRKTTRSSQGRGGRPGRRVLRCRAWREVEIRSGNRRFETVGPNGIFGEMAMIDESARSATVVALTDVTVAPGIPGTARFSFHGPAHAVLRTKGDARPRQPAAPAEQGGLGRPGAPTFGRRRLSWPRLGRR